MKSQSEQAKEAEYIKRLREQSNRIAEEMRVPPIEIARPTGYVFASDPPRERQTMGDVVW
jgi:hypothetical protein